MRTPNLTGRRFGRLMVTRQAPTLKYSRWHCVCDCGGQIVVTLQLLKMGEKGTRSCGCLRREQQSANLKRLWANGNLRRPKVAVDTACMLSEVWR